jgi:ribosome biogenesis ATPase
MHNDINIDHVVEHLRIEYSEYARVPLNQLVRNVEKAFDEMKPDGGNGNNGKGKKRKRSQMDGSNTNSNVMNDTLLSTYESTDTGKRKKPRLMKKEEEDVPTFNIETPTARFSDMGGIESVLVIIEELVLRPIKYPELYMHLGVQPPRGILLYGPPGCGKSHLANAIAGELGIPFIKINAPEIVSGVSGESEAKIRNLFNKAISLAPSIIFMDEIDAITPKRGGNRQMEQRIVAQLITCMDDLHALPPSKPVMVIGATNRKDSLDPALRRAGRFDREIPLGIPDENARENILRVLSSKMRLEGNFNMREIAKNTPGFVGADLEALTQEAAAIAINRCYNIITDHEKNVNNWKSTVGNIEYNVDVEMKEPRLTEDKLEHLYIVMEDFEKAISKVQPSAKREGFATVPNVTWEDVGALQSLRKELENAILAPIKFREYYEKVGLNSQSAGVLLYGPPGCGKTLLAKAIANECQLNFISVKGPELLNKYVGESEKAVRRIFSMAQSSSPCIIFFDEIDSLCPTRTGGENQVTERVVNQMLTEMDGLDLRKEIFIISASNRPDMIDSALLRPGRLDKLLYVPLPSYESRKEILQTLSRKTPLDNDINLDEIAEKCEGFSGADLALLVKEAAQMCVTEILDMGIPQDLFVRQTHFLEAMKGILPSITKPMEQIYTAMQKNIVDSRTRT